MGYLESFLGWESELWIIAVVSLVQCNCSIPAIQESESSKSIGRPGFPGTLQIRPPSTVWFQNLPSLDGNVLCRALNRPGPYKQLGLLGFLMSHDFIRRCGAWKDGRNLSSTAAASSGDLFLAAPDSCVLNYFDLLPFLSCSCSHSLLSHGISEVLLMNPRLVS